MTQIPKSVRVRAYIDGVVKSSKPGTTLFSDEIATAIRKNICYGPSTKDVGTMLRERSDVKNISDGIWEVL